MICLIPHRARIGVVVALVLASVGPVPRPVRAQGSNYDDLVTLFSEWRQFQPPRVTRGVPDYSPAAMEAQHRELARYQARLAAIDPTGWSVGQQVDYELVRAEMNGLDFDHRVLRPWARDPAFYIVAHESQSDTPAHEGSAVFGALELWTYRFPVSGQALDEVRAALGAAPALLAEARRNLTGNGRDLWKMGIRSTREQSDMLRSLAARLATVQPALVAEVETARRAVDEYRAWLESELPTKTGPSGIGIDNYDWYLKHVHLLPYTWGEQVALVERELARAHAALALEEHRNRGLTPLVPVASEEEHARRFNDAVTDYIAFLRDKQVVTVSPYMDGALRARIGRFSSSAPREFFSEVDYRDPMVMRTHGFHWIDLARMAEQPHPSPIRRAPLLYNIWDGRSEGLATGMEEMMMHAGLFDRSPRSRELVLILLAQRGARAMGDLMMHANRWSIDEASAFASTWTPRGWLRPEGGTVWGEQHLYLRQPAYGTSYLVGKIEIEKLMAERARQLGDRFTTRAFMDELQASGMIPVSLIRREMSGPR